MMYPSCSRPSRWAIAALGVFLLTVSFAIPSHGQVGLSSALFLRIEPDSRSAGMGNSGVAVADNANAMFWNPSGLAFQKSTQAGITHSNWLPQFDAGLFYEYLVGTYHVDGVGTFGGNVRYLDLGETVMRDDEGNRIGKTRSFQLAVGSSYGVKLTDRLGVGTSLRFIHSKLSSGQREGTGEGSASTLAADFSGLYRTAPFSLVGSDATFSLGLNLANLGGTLDFNKNSPEKAPLPATFRFGPALTLEFDEFNTLTLATDFTKALVSTDRVVTEGDTVLVGNTGFEALFDSWGSAPGLSTQGGTRQLSLIEQFTVGTGLEYWYNDLFALRTGYYYEDPDNGDRQFLTFGAGLRYNFAGVDISYLYTSENEHPLANTLRFSLLFEFK